MMASAEESDLGGLTAELAQLAVEPDWDLESRVFAYACRVPTPIGTLHAALTERGVAFLRTDEWLGGDEERFAEAFRARFARPLQPAPTPPGELVTALAGHQYGTVEVDLSASTEFAAEVLRATARIPAGQTRTYAWLAKEVGRPGAVRAVGSALARNPVPLLIPCHRVTRSDGGLGNYLFGLGMKESLLRQERAAAV